MNGRIYDYNLGRFLSVDPFIQSPGNSQSLNPYSYILNNPLSGTDPTGYLRTGMDGSAGFGLGLGVARGLGLFTSEEVRQIQEAAENAGAPIVGTTAVGEATVELIRTGDAVKAGTVLFGVINAANESDDSNSDNKSNKKNKKRGGNGKNTSKGNNSKSSKPSTGDRSDKNEKTYQTYTKENKETGEVYTGRTSGTGTPEENVANRDRSHHKNEEGFGPAKLDKSSSNKDAIRGREQQMIEANGGAQSQGGTSGNAINGISNSNNKKDLYLKEAEKEFGKD